MRKKTYHAPDSAFCLICGMDLEDGEEYYYHGNGIFTCCEECAETYEDDE